ncbi:MAG: hypothetical protein IPM46_10550 [Flavobacteriales bacterium]|nr:hypothetical protein [Flavobacteriales bacterium]
MAHPVSGDAAVTVEGSLSTGGYTWCESQVAGNTLILSADPPLATYANGTLLRFASPVSASGSLYIQCPGLAVVPLVRTDGLALTPGQLREGLVLEVMHVDGRFMALNVGGSGCPSGFLQAHSQLCMEAVATPTMLYRDGVDRCANLGGKLCTWDEYIAACTALEGQLSNLFADWEWLDETSNHAHGADQAGRFTCLSQRHVSAIPTSPGSTRCCYRPR